MLDFSSEIPAKKLSPGKTILSQYFFREFPHSRARARARARARLVLEGVADLSLQHIYRRITNSYTERSV